MTLPPVIRIFFAIDLPAPTKEKLANFISTLKRKSKSHAIRWSRPENLHVTLQFLAEMHSEHLHLLINHVRAEVAGVIKEISLSFGRIHLFPNPYRPRVIVLDVTPQDELAMLSGLIGHGMKASNYQSENRPFRAHLTLGRIKHTHANLNFLSEFTNTPVAEDILLKEIVLFRSEPQPEGSKYTVVERIALKQPA